MTNRLAATLFLISLGGCQGQHSADEAMQRAKAAEAAASANADEIQRLKAQTQAIFELASSLVESPADLSLETKNYGMALNKHGQFPVIVDSVEPYLDGFKVRLAIINTTSVTFRGATLAVAWAGAQEQRATFDWPHKEVKSLEVFRPGTETLTEVVIPSVTAAQMRRLSIAVKFDQLSYRP